MNIFNISTAREFYDQLVIPEWNDFRADNSSQRRAITAIMFAYHFHEKAYNDKFDRSKSSMAAGDADNFDAARQLVNGTKHIVMKLPTSAQPGFSSDFSSDYQRPLTIEVAGSQKGVDEVISEMIAYWEAEKVKAVF